MRVRRIAFRLAARIIGAALVLVIAYLGLLLYAWVSDPNSKLPEPTTGAADFSRLAHAQAATVIRPEADTQLATAQLQELVREAVMQGKKITIAGAKHSMGGHTLLDGSLCIDMRCDAFRKIGEIRTTGEIATVHVGAGATWHELLTALDREGWSVGIMQSNDDFTIGGSISVNCHGWQPNSPPIDSTVESFRILLADGSVRECRRDRAEDRDLFRAVCGGYGLLGILLDAELRIVPNALYRAEEFSAKAETYSTRFRSIVPLSDSKIGLAYGRISVAPGPWFLRDARIIRFLEAPINASAKNTVATNGGQLSPATWEISLARTAFRASALSDFGKLGRWTIERMHGQTHRVVSRNGILQTPSDWFANRDPAITEILHEYFIPQERLTDFLDRIRLLLREQKDVNLLNITVRDVQRDDESLLTYAPSEVFGLVMLFRYRADVEHDDQMRQTTERLIDAALSCGGSYYLPYRPHATLKQFKRAYPASEEFYLLKRKYDPLETFENAFYETFIKLPQ